MIVSTDYPVPNSSSSARVSIARAWLAAFTNWDLLTMYNLMTEAPDFHYGYLPASIGMPPKSRSEWHMYNAFMSNVLPDFNVTILRIHDTSESGPVVAHIEGRAKSTTGAPFCMEYIIFIYIRPEQGILKLYKVEEFVDSRFVHEYFDAERERRKGVGGTGEDQKVAGAKL